MKLLLHACCAPCLDQCYAGLFAEFGRELDVTCAFINPNIHPLLEFRKRLKAVQVLNESLRLPLVLQREYGLMQFLQDVWDGGKAGRCKRCYRERFLAAARLAAEKGVGIFSSTLCASQEQDHRDMRQAGEEAAVAWGVEFLYRDWRALADSVPRRRGLYRQQYCGCIFSEEERYRATETDLYRGPG